MIVKLAQDDRNIAALYCKDNVNQAPGAKIEKYYKIFCESNPTLTLKRTFANIYLYEWRSPVLFYNGFAPCLILEARTQANLGNRISLQNKNILEKIAYSNFFLREDNILEKKADMQVLGGF